jgi:hypothetical protein
MVAHEHPATSKVVQIDTQQLSITGKGCAADRSRTDTGGAIFAGTGDAEDKREWTRNRMWVPHFRCGTGRHPRGRAGGAVTDTTADSVTEADRLVKGIAPAVGSTPGVETRDVVLVIGPWLAGTTSLITALRERLPDVTFVETGDLAVTEAPKAVVFVAPALGAVTESDCALLDLATPNTDLVIGVVSKIDAHHGWRDVLAADREALRAHAHRYRDVPWVGVAAAPDVGEPDVDELVELLEKCLADAGLARRNRLRAWENRLATVVRRCEEEAAGVGREARVAELRGERSGAVQRRRLAESERTIALRSQIQQARVQLAQFARNRCTSVRDELQEDAAGMTRRRLPAFEEYVHKRLGDVVDEVNTGITTHLSDMATELGLTAPADAPPPPSPQIPSRPLTSPKLQPRLMALGAGVGVGLALALSRLFANLAPGFTIAGLVAGGVIGLAVAMWVVGIRGLRRDRAALHRWVADVTVEQRARLEQLVAARVSAVEPTLTTEQAEADEAAAARLAERLVAIDAELREHGLAAAGAAARRDRDLPGLQSALEAVRDELDGEPDLPDPAEGAFVQPASGEINDSG